MYRTTTMKRVLLFLITTAAALITETPVFPQIPISTIEELQKIGNDPSYPLNGSYCLVNDIEATSTRSWNDGKGFKPIGTYKISFTGSLNGNNHSIKNLYINRPDNDYIGIFSSSNGIIYNLNLNNIYIVGRSLVGSISSIGGALNCHVSGIIIGNEWYTGGIAGDGVNIVNSSFTGNVIGQKYVGGLAGYSSSISYSNTSCTVIGDSYVGGIAGESGTIKNCYATGRVEGNLYVGGAAGVNYGTISDCYANVHVVGHGEYNGGLVGWNPSGIDRCYATGKVDAIHPPSGGLVGATHIDPEQWKPCWAKNSYYDMNTTGRYREGNDENGYPKTTAEMMTQATFTTWDFQNVWWMIPGKTYPLLRPVRYVGVNIKPEQSFGLPAEYKIIFNEPVRSFTFDDVDLSLSTIEGIRGMLSPDDAPTTITAWDCFTTWTLRLEDAASTTGLIVMRLPVAAAMNAANYPTTESAFIRIPLLQPARGDLNYDGDVNAADRAILIEMILNPQSLWLKRLLPSEYDLNSDSKLDIGDVVIFLGF